MRIAALGCFLALIGCDKVFGLERPDPPDAPPPPPPEWIAVAAGGQHTCGVQVDQTLWCWGENARGETGQPDTIPEVIEPAQVSDARWTAVSAGTAHTCAIDFDRAVWCWGGNGRNAIGANTGADHVAPTRVLEDAIAITAGHLHTCAIKSDGSLWCWGRNIEGQLALPIVAGVLDVPVPTAVATQLRWRSVSGGMFHTCGVTTGGELACWGENTNRQVFVGAGAAARYSEPQIVEPGTTWIDVATGSQHTCALRADGSLRCMGFNNVGQLGGNAPSNTGYDLPTPPGFTWTHIAADGDQSCALRSDRTLWCWGNNAEFQLAQEQPASIFTPSQVAGAITEWTSLAVGGAHICAIDVTGVLWCAGSNGVGQLGDGQGGGRTAPSMVDGTWRLMAVGGSSVCARDGSGSVHCWGKNAQGQLADGTGRPRQQPQFVVLGRTDGVLAVGEAHACAQTTAGANEIVSCWGRNVDGQLGTGVPSPSENTVMAAMYMSPTDLTAGSHTCARNTNNDLHCWGPNDKGQLGFSRSGAPNPSPYFVSAPWANVSAGLQHTCGVRTGTAGDLYCWGSNEFGQRGVTGPDSPTLIMSGFKRAVLGGYHSCAITLGDGLVCWGANSDGQVGDNSTTDRPTLRPVGDVSAFWQWLGLGRRHTCGIQFDRDMDPGGTLWCWGDNSRGQLGDGTRTDRLVPTQIGTQRDWVYLAAGGDETCALKANFTLWCWGANYAGQIGDGSAWSPAFVRIAP